ncbi:hypothetical protein OF83DRAFT_1173967 [Amylostereum chailletii]|nr:hypothetical protein OF83DRAFT_1173967 [Amylostereum chailletii]
MPATKRTHDLSQREDAPDAEMSPSDEPQSKRQRKDDGIEHLLYKHYDANKSVDYMAMNDEDFNRSKPHYPILRRWRVAKEKLLPGREHHVLPSLKQAPNGTFKDTRHPHWYLTEGDIIIRADHILFKLKHEHLCLHSPVLKKLIEQTVSENKVTIKGVPVLDSDFATAREWALMCLVIYNDNPFPKRPALLEDVVTLLELSRTLQSLFLRHIAMDILASEYPITLAGYQKVALAGRRSIVPIHILIHSIHIALEYEIPMILPVAMMELARHSPSDIILGHQEGGLLHRTRLRDKEVLARVLLGRERLLNGRHDFTLGFLQKVPLPTDKRTTRHWVSGSTFSPACTNPPFDVKYAEWKKIVEEARLDCRTWLLYVGRDFHKHWDQMYGATESHDVISRAFCPLKDGALRDLEAPLCKKCRDKVREDMHKGMQQLWMSVPSAFGMGTWFDIAVATNKADRKLMGEPREGPILRRNPDEVYQCPVTIPL